MHTNLLTQLPLTTHTNSHLKPILSQSLFSIITKPKPTHIKKKSVPQQAENSVSAGIMIRALILQAANVTVKLTKLMTDNLDMLNSNSTSNFNSIKRLR